MPRARGSVVDRRWVVLGMAFLFVILYPPHFSSGGPSGAHPLRGAETVGHPFLRGTPPSAPSGGMNGLPWLHAVPGNPVGQLRSLDGAYFPLRGVDVNGLIQYGPDWNESIPITRGDLAEMHALGITFIRLSLSWSLLEPAPGTFNQSYLSDLSQVVDWAGTEGIYVLVDMHQDLYNPYLAPNGTEQDGFPTWAALAGNASRTCPVYLNVTTCLEDPAVDNAWNAFWNNTTVPGFIGLQEAYAQAWQTLASTFANSSTVAGYDLMNEPATGTVTSSLGSGFCPNGTWEWEYQWEDCFLLPFYQMLIHAIRHVDDRHAIFFEPSVYTDALNWAPWNPVSLGDTNIVYEPHVYTNVFGPTANWSGNDSALIAAYQNAQSNAQQFGGTAWFVGEYGTNPDRWHDGWVEANVNLANQYDVGSSFWEWKDGISVPTITEPGGSWGVVNVNGTLRNTTDRAQILASPHPVGAGAGAQVGTADFNFTNATYSLTISNTAPGGWVTVYLPSFWYPSGFGVNGTYTGHSYQNYSYVLPGGTDLEVSLLNVTCSCTGNYTVHVTRPLRAEGWLTGSVVPATANLTVSDRAVPLHNGSFTLALPPGNVSLMATAPGYVSQTQNALVVAGSTVRVVIALTVLPPPPARYSVVFSESGLTAGTNWSATVGTTTIAASRTTIAFSETNGTYRYSIGTVPGYTAAPSSGNVTVNGAAVNVTIVFAMSPPPPVLSLYAVTFIETGLRAGTAWTVVMNGTSLNSTTASVTFQKANGSYGFTIELVNGYTVRPSSGIVTVKGVAIHQSIAFTNTSSKGPASATPGFLGLPGYDGYLVILALVAVVAMVAAVVYFRSRHGPAPRDTPSSPPKGDPGEESDVPDP